jgi:hypothetical protein
VRTYFSELSPWLMIAIGFVFFAAISAICRYGLGGVASPERRAQVEEHAGKLLSVFGATFAFLIGFAITIHTLCESRLTLRGVIASRRSRRAPFLGHE